MFSQCPGIYGMASRNQPKNEKGGWWAATDGTCKCLNHQDTTFEFFVKGQARRLPTSFEVSRFLPRLKCPLGNGNIVDGRRGGRPEPGARTEKMVWL